MARLTLTTIKIFIRKNPNLYINNRANFDGMQDCVIYADNSNFVLARKSAENYDHKNKMGIDQAWFVLNSRDHFTEYEDEQFKGYEVYNCCGKFILAIKKEITK